MVCFGPRAATSLSLDLMSIGKGGFSPNKNSISANGCEVFKAFWACQTVVNFCKIYNYLPGNERLVVILLGKDREHQIGLALFVPNDINEVMH